MAKTKLGQELISGLNEAIAHERKQKKLRATTIEIPEPARKWKRKAIIKLRKDCFEVSQRVFALYLSVTISTVRAWEQGQKTPGSAASRLLELAELDPSIFHKLAQEQLS